MPVQSLLLPTSDADPATDVSGTQLYAKAGGFYTRSPAGVVSQVGSGGGGITAWTAGTYSAGQVVTRGPYLWRAQSTTSEDPFLIEGNPGSASDYTLVTAASPGASQSGSELTLLNGGTSASSVAYRQSVNSGFLGMMIAVDLVVTGTADELMFGLFDSSLAQTGNNLNGLAGFYGAGIDIYDPLTAEIRCHLNGVVTSTVAYSNANATNVGSAYSRWFWKMTQNGANWDLQMLRPTKSAAVYASGYNANQEDDLVPIATFTNVARPSYTNWRFVIGARSGASSATFKCRAVYLRNFASGNWTAIGRLPTGL